jgi:endonuclease/exonuclease/phosphatase family metal-dependent hydrolase
MLQHPDAGPLALFGYREGASMSLQLENGAHGGPGPNEVSAFAILPREATVGKPIEGTLRPSHLREMALRALGGVMLPGPEAGERPSPAVTHARAEECPRVHLRLVSYNVHGCRGMDGKYSPQRIARVLSRLQPDIICLQELDHERGRSGGTHQVAQLAESLHAEFYFHTVSEFDDGRFGNAVLSHHPLRLVDHGPLPSLKGFPGLEERGVLWAEVDVEGITLQVLNTHLSILERERRLQAEALLTPRWLGENLEGVPIILCGDFNTGPDGWTCRRLGEVLRNVEDGVARHDTARTWSGRLPLRRIDHVYVGGSLRPDRVTAPRTRLTRVASDHLPLVVDLSLPVPATELNPRPCEEA